MQDQFDGAKVKALHLKPIITIPSDSSCVTAIEIMREKGFDQLPVLSKVHRLVGLVTLGNILSRLTHGRATGESPVSDAMFDFSKLSEVITDPRDSAQIERTYTKPSGKNKSRKFIEITPETSLFALNRFFEWNSAAVVTEKDEQGVMRPTSVATKVDLLTWLVRHGKKQT